MTTLNLSQNINGNSLKIQSSHSTIQFDINSILTKEVSAVFLTRFSIDTHEKLLKSDTIQDSPIYLSKEAFEVKQQLSLLGTINKTSLNYKIMPINVSITINDFTVTAFLSDSIYTGSLAYFIEDANHKRAFFSGDIRLNGSHKKRTKKWIRKINEGHIEAIILDVPYETNVDYYSEVNLLDHLGSLLNTSKLTSLDIPDENLDFIHKLVSVTHVLQKTIVLNSDLYHLLTYFYPDAEALPLNDETATSIINTPDKYILVNIKDDLDRFAIGDENTYAIVDSLDNVENENNIPVKSHLIPLDIVDLETRLTITPTHLMVINKTANNEIITY